MPNRDEEPDKEFDDAFKMFARMEELKEAINNSKGTKKEKLQEEYIELLKNDNKVLDKKRLEAESRVPSFSGGAPHLKPSQSGTKGAETKCKRWLISLMSDDGKPEKTKIAYRTEAQGEFEIGTKAFLRAWANAIEETGNTVWSRPGRKV